MKLYWRYKKDGKWTWRPANVSNEDMQWWWDYVKSKEESE